MQKLKKLNKTFIISNTIQNLTLDLGSYKDKWWQQKDWLIGVLMARQHRKVNLCQLRGKETGSVG